MPLMQRAGGGRLYEGITGVGNDGTANAQCFGIVQCASGAIYSMAMDNPTIALDSLRRYVNRELDDSGITRICVYEKLIELKS